jgi:SAM-dependent methyltransferase
MADERASLTTTRFWDDYWSETPLPAEVTKGSSPYLDEILSVLDRFLPPDGGSTALEIGGAPGQWLAYVHRRFRYDVHALDSSPVGVEQTRSNLRLLGIEGIVHEGDMFSASIPVDFDVVYSLGLVEHFENLSAAVTAHLRFLRPGGLLVIGCPNLRGLNRVILRRLSPALLELHNLDSMDLRRWEAFEREHRLEAVFKAYIGGFEPRMFTRRERAGATAMLLSRVLALLGEALALRVARPLRRLNSRLWSGYVIGV